MLRSEHFPKVVAAVAVVFWLGSGLWSFLAPRSFFVHVATFPPYNRHLFHDIGSFSMGLGVCALVAVCGGGGLRSVLSGLAVASVIHEVSHLIDRHLGGRPTDHVGLVLLAIVTAAAAVATWRTTESAAAPRAEVRA